MLTLKKLVLLIYCPLLKYMVVCLLFVCVLLLKLVRLELISVKRKVQVRVVMVLVRCLVIL